MAGIYNFTTVSSAMFARGRAARHCSDPVIGCIVFHKYLLGGDIMMLSRLYARPCHTFLVATILLFEL